MKNIVMDLDHTICTPMQGEDQSLDKDLKYSLATPNVTIIEALRRYQKQGFHITIFTSRNMRTFNGDVEAIKANTLPIIMSWLEKHAVPYDQVIVGKPWCGTEGFYVDDRAIRPSEFANLSFEQISQLLEKEKSTFAEPAGE